MGIGGYGQFITHCLCCSLSLRRKTPHTLPLLQCEGSSHGRQFSTNFSNVSPSQGLQLFTNCPNVGPFHGVQSFRKRLLQRGSPTGSQALPANLLWHGLLSPWVCRSWQEPALVRGSPWGHSLLQASTCSSVGSLPRSTGGYLLHCGPPWTAGGQPSSPWPASPWSSSQAAREDSLLWHLEHLLPPPSSLTLVSAELFLPHHLTPLTSLLFPQSFFLPFLK